MAFSLRSPSARQAGRGITNIRLGRVAKGAVHFKYRIKVSTVSKALGRP